MSTLSSIQGAARRFIAAALALTRRLREQRPYQESELADMARGQGEHVEGSVSQLIASYNDLIRTTNRR